MTALVPADQLEEGQVMQKRVEVNDETWDLIVTRIDGQAHAFHNECPHQGRPLNFAPNQFLLTEQQQLVCAAHGATFDLPRGQCVAGPCVGARLKSVAVEEAEGLVRLSVCH